MSVIDMLIGGAAVISVLALRSLVRPAPGVNRHPSTSTARRGRSSTRYGEDSLSPFLCCGPTRP